MVMGSGVDRVTHMRKRCCAVPRLIKLRERLSPQSRLVEIQYLLCTPCMETCRGLFSIGGIAWGCIGASHLDVYYTDCNASGLAFAAK